jgi:histone acetyltransferase (RNA polymerase elongator complex component)
LHRQGQGQKQKTGGTERRKGSIGVDGALKHRNIAIFVPHNGCPCRCSFCNQRIISGKEKQPSAESVKDAVRVALASKGNYGKTELAFFGGSFTAIDRDYMISLLEAAYEFIKNGSIDGIRISTRPDRIDEEIIGILKRYSVTAVELGAQSLDDEVLALNRRGHTVKDIENAFYSLKDAGFETGLQMMTGLYGSSYEKDIKTAERIIALHPDTARIYPTVVLKGTYLAELYEKGIYKPMTLDETVSLCADILPKFIEADIDVIRLGLHYSDDVEKNCLAGGFHPALMELVEGEIYLRKALKILENYPKNKPLTLYVNEKELSKMKGQQKRNEKILINQGFCCTIKGHLFLDKYTVLVEE